MTTSIDSHAVKSLRRSAVRAMRAPSVHNTQPWRFVLRPRGIEFYADRSRQLHILDPQGRQLLLSCGCALFNARVALADSGVGVEVERFPDPSRADLVARITSTDSAVVPGSDNAAIARLEPAIDIRQTNRRQFVHERVPADVVDALVSAARAEHAELLPIVRDDHRQAVARLSQLADRIENTDPAYRAELRVWTTDDPSRVDGVPAYAVPHVDGSAHDDIPIRDFDTRGMGWLPSRTESSTDQCLLLLGTYGDNPATWLRAGEALERVLLEVAQRGFTASPLTQAIEVPRTREGLRSELGVDWSPHVVLRVGKAPLTPLTRRRRLVDVLDENL